jgi:hypothetical protein
MSRWTRPSGCTRASSPRGTISPGSPSSSTVGGSANRRQQGPSAPSSIPAHAREGDGRLPDGDRHGRGRPTKRLARGGNARRSLHVGRAARLRRPRGCRAVGLSRNGPAGKSVNNDSHLIATFLYRAYTLLTTLSDVDDMTTKSRARAPVFTTAMSAILPFTGSFLQKTNASEAVQHFHAWRRGSKLDS